MRFRLRGAVASLAMVHFSKPASPCGADPRSSSADL